MFIALLRSCLIFYRFLYRLGKSSLLNYNAPFLEQNSLGATVLTMDLLSKKEDDGYLFCKVGNSINFYIFTQKYEFN